MAEYKQYITQAEENGNVLISEDVVAAIAEHAVAEVEGAAGIFFGHVRTAAAGGDGLERSAAGKRYSRCPGAESARRGQIPGILSDKVAQ